MTMTRMFRRFVCRLMLGVLVFGQLAIAAYACPAPVSYTHLRAHET